MAAATVGVASWGCGGSSASDSNDRDDAIVIDGSPSGPDADGCAGNETACPDGCANLETDPLHCGACAEVCPAEMASCTDGTCHAPLVTTWAEYFGAAAGGSTVYGVAVDAGGNTYVTGVMAGTVTFGGSALVSAGAGDIIVASFAPDGTHRWSERFGGSADDYGQGIAVADDKVYVTGGFSGSVDFGGGAVASAGGFDGVVLVLAASTGVVASHRQFGSPDDDALIDVAVDADANVTIAGAFDLGTLVLDGAHALTGLAARNAFVASFDAGGAVRWSRVLSTAATDLSGCYALAVDPSGNVVTVGGFSGSLDAGAGTLTSAGSLDGFVASYTSTGVLRFARPYGGIFLDSLDGVDVDAVGNIVVGGSYDFQIDITPDLELATGTDGANGFWVALDADGEFRAARGLTTTEVSIIADVAFDPDGDVVVAGKIDGTPSFGPDPGQDVGSVEILVAGFSATTGASTYLRTYGGTGFDEARAVAVTPGGAVAVGGNFVGTADLGTGPLVGVAAGNGFAMMIAP